MLSEHLLVELLNETYPFMTRNGKNTGFQREQTN